MQKELTINTIGAIFFGWANQMFSVYFGPASVAFMAVVARMFYSHDDLTIRQFFTVWSVSSFVAFVALHVLRWQGVNHDLSVALWGASAFLGREICDVALYLIKRSGAVVLNKIKGG